MGNSFVRIKKKSMPWVIGGVIAVGIFLIWKFVLATPINDQIPEEFYRARGEGAALGANIVSIYDRALVNLEHVAEKDREKKYLEALNLTLEETGANKEALEKSQALALQLEKMVNSTSKLDSQEARDLIVEAVAAEINLVTHLIAYNGYYNELLGNLQAKFSGDATQDRVAELIDKLNNEARIINRLNARFNEKMGEFDSRYGRK